jgi:hypothetical protein
VNSIKQRNESKPIPGTKSGLLIVLPGVITIILQPLFMTATMALAVYELVPGDFVNFSLDKWIITVLLFTIFFPFLSILLLKISGLISNAKMHKPRDRYLPLMASMIFYFLA